MTDGVSERVVAAGRYFFNRILRKYSYALASLNLLLRSFKAQRPVPLEQTYRGQVVSDAPILVAQFSNGSEFDDVPLGDPFMMLLMPPERFLRNYTFATPTFGDANTDFELNFINIVAPTEDADLREIKLDGAGISPDEFTEVAGTAFSTARIEVTVGSHTVTGANPFGLYIYGFSAHHSYGFPGGLAF